MNITLNLPLNSVSFGQVSIALLRACHAEDKNVSVFPIGGVDVAAQKINKDFGQWLENKINNGLDTYDRRNPTFKLWHINGALESFGAEQNLITFHETDQLTKVEKSILKQQKNVFVTANYTKDVMNDSGIDNVKFIDLGFDHDNFYPVQRKNNEIGVVTFGLFGKFEFRKAHEKVLKAWAARYGNNPKYRLLAAVYNPHFTPEQMNGVIANVMGGVKYWNITFLPIVKTNAEYNDIVNNIDIVIGCSRAEGRDLPVFHAVGLGKHCVGLNAHAYKDYLTNENAVLIEPTGMVPAVDNIFFHHGAPFNQGNFYDWNVDDFISACQVAVNRYTSSNVNVAGQKLAEKTYKNTLSQLLA